MEKPRYLDLGGAIANKKMEITSTAQEYKRAQRQTEYLAQMLLRHVAELKELEDESQFPSEPGL